MLSGKVKFYQPFSQYSTLKRPGEADVKVQTLKDLVAADVTVRGLGFDAANYKNGACDLGIGRSNERDGVGGALIGKWVPFARSMPVNVYFDDKGKTVRASMKLCDNNFSGPLPRPVPGMPAAAALAPTECFATVFTPPRFEDRSERVMKIAATKRQRPKKC